MKGIVYTSNTGSTAAYAEFLAQITGLPFCSLKEAKHKFSAGDEIIYLGWIMASGIKGYKKAQKKYKVCAICGVGMGKNGSRIKEVRERNEIPAEMPLFTLQGNFEIENLRGIYKKMMSMMAKTVEKELSEKEDRTLEEEDMLDMMLHGGKRVCKENLEEVINWYNTRK